MPGLANLTGEAWPPLFDDFPVSAGSLLWTITTPTGATASATTAALMTLMQGVGGNSWTLSGAAGVVVAQHQLLTYLGFVPATGPGCQMDFNVMIDTALSTATNTYQLFYGMTDGTTSASNFVGLMCGYNPVTNAVDMRWGLGVGTLAALAASGATLPYAPILGPPAALDVLQVLRLRISPDWKTIQGFVNGVASPIYSVGQAFGGSTAAPISPATSMKVAFGVTQAVNAAQTAVIVTDTALIQVLGRKSNA